ncbi:retrovirus-related pol polyprotein from transposon TNT 1-94 [Tanacetum coccineum]
MFCDNSASLHFANEPGVQRGARHYHRRYHYVREGIALGEIKFLKVYTDDNLADPFTNALPNGKLTQHARSMRLCLCKGGQFEEALKVCKQSMEKGWVPNFSTMKMLVVGLAKGLMVQEARELVGQMKERFSENSHMWDEVEEILSKSKDACDTNRID